MGAGQKRCFVCHTNGRRAHEVQKRKVLAELSPNMIKARRRKEEWSRSAYRCSLCGIYLYKVPRCWSEHIDLVE